MEMQKVSKMSRKVEPGYTIPGFAKRYGLSVNKVRRAEKLKEIHAVTFAGLKRIPPAEAKRLEELLGLKPRDEDAEG